MNREVLSDASYWFVGASYGGNDDQTERFLADGIWENGYEDRYLDDVRRVKVGDHIAIKAAFRQRRNLPFDNHATDVGVMRIKAIGVVTRNYDDGRRLDVAWDKDFKSRDWYFYTYRTTIAEVDLDRPAARKLVEFAFGGAPQEYAWFIEQGYLSAKAPRVADTASSSVSEELAEAEIISSTVAEYRAEDIVRERCFLPVERIQTILNQWEVKRNLILQGPPGTGKTWLAKRLGYALIGSNERSVRNSQLQVVQFHPSLSYEDFVRGWRPDGAQSLALRDGILMESIDAALRSPDARFVLVIEEINRGNPAQIFGEMLTLLENSKRSQADAMQLSYRRDEDERVYVPENLYVIGTMNVADRSLALVDLALRRRFAFVDLEPTLNDAWGQWCLDHGISDEFIAAVRAKISALNEMIASSVSHGPQFRIGHSFVTPQDRVTDEHGWFRDVVDTEIGPLLDEYWYDDLAAATEARKLLRDE